MQYGAIILAAGGSTRMGSSKQLLKIGKESLIRRTIGIALEIAPLTCTVVLGANFEKHKKEIEDLPIDIVHNRNWEQGMGSSIKVGIQNLKRYQLDAFYILVCDQPMLKGVHLINIAKQYENSGARIVASRYKETLGVPAIFDWEMHETLLLLPEKEGAKQLISKYCNQFVNFEGGEVDLDTREDFERFNQGN